MEIEVKHIGPYREVTVYETGIQMTSSVLSKEESFDLAKEFQTAIDDLTENWVDK